MKQDYVGYYVLNVTAPKHFYNKTINSKKYKKSYHNTLLNKNAD